MNAVVVSNSGASGWLPQVVWIVRTTVFPAVFLLFLKDYVNRLGIDCVIRSPRRCADHQAGAEDQVLLIRLGWVEHSAYVRQLVRR
jgi:hypothetical protein